MIQIGIRDRRQQIGESRARRAHRNAQLPQRPCVALRRVTCRNFVAGIHDRNIVAAARLKDSFEVGSVYTENMPNPGLLQRPHQELATRDHGHRTPPST